MWIVYLARHKTTESSYVGITSQSIAQRRAGHFHDALSRNAPHPFARAIRKYGRDAFSWSEIGRVASELEALEMERFFIATLKPRYNATEGGDIRHRTRTQRVAAHDHRTVASYLQRRGVAIVVDPKALPLPAPPVAYQENDEPVWWPAPGYDGIYEISDHGQVRSCDRKVKCWSNGGTMLRKGAMLSPRPMSDGRLFVTIYRNAARRDVAVSVLVAMTFVGLPLPAQRVIRRDRDLLNDRASNLYWGDAKDVAEKRRRTGADCIGENHPNTKISDEQVRFIRKMRGVITQTDLARSLGIERGTVTAIQLGKSRIEAGGM